MPKVNDDNIAGAGNDVVEQKELVGRRMNPNPRLQRYLIAIEYIGTRFAGAQQQPNCRTVVGVLEDTSLMIGYLPATTNVERISKRKPGEVIGLKEGLEMLNILKNYSERTSILDDFNFYEKREKLLKTKRSSKSAIQADVFEKAESIKQFKGGDKVLEEELKTNSVDPAASLITLTKNLSINSRPFKSSV